MLSSLVAVFGTLAMIMPCAVCASAGQHASALPFAATIPAAPNIIFMLADNAGYGDLGCCGSRLHRTPNLDRMAERDSG